MEVCNRINLKLVDSVCARTSIYFKAIPIFIYDHSGQW